MHLWDVAVSLLGPSPPLSWGDLVPDFISKERELIALPRVSSVWEQDPVTAASAESQQL